MVPIVVLLSAALTTRCAHDAPPAPPDTASAGHSISVHPDEQLLAELRAPATPAYVRTSSIYAAAPSYHNLHGIARHDIIDQHAA